MNHAVLSDNVNDRVVHDSYVTHVTIACAVQLGVDIFNSLVGTGLTATIGDELISYMTASLTNQIKI